MALLAILEWTLAGMLYPLAMQLSGVRLSSADNAHFFSSLVLFGLVAAAYPFFAATAFAVRILYPAFMEPYHMRTSDVADLERLERWTWIYLALGLLVPMLALALMIRFGDQHHRVMMGFVSAGSLGGFVFLVWLARRCRTRSASSVRRPAWPTSVHREKNRREKQRARCLAYHRRLAWFPRMASFSASVGHDSFRSPDHPESHRQPQHDPIEWSWRWVLRKYSLSNARVIPVLHEFPAGTPALGGNSRDDFSLGRARTSVHLPP